MKALASEWPSVLCCRPSATSNRYYAACAHSQSVNTSHTIGTGLCFLSLSSLERVQMRASSQRIGIPGQIAFMEIAAAMDCWIRFWPEPPLLRTGFVLRSQDCTNSCRICYTGARKIKRDQSQKVLACATQRNPANRYLYGFAFSDV